LFLLAAIAEIVSEALVGTMDDGGSILITPIDNGAGALNPARAPGKLGFGERSRDWAQLICRDRWLA
jgi:hypothetical protein